MAKFLPDDEKVLAEWHPTKNGDLDPSKLRLSSHQIVWWLGECGHEWEARVVYRTGKDRAGCPVCSGRKVIAGVNDFATLFPSMRKEWHPTKNSGLEPEGLGVGSKRKVWWLGECGHEWEASVVSRCKARSGTPTGCAVCAGRVVLAGFNDLATTHPHLAAEWHPTKNGDLTPQQVKYSVRKPVWWLGKCGHEWEAVILNRAYGNKCYQCLGRAKSTPQGLLKDDPELWSQVHPTRNDLQVVSKLKRFSVVKVWWVGTECKHEWEAGVNHRSMGHGCPYCSGNEVLPGFNDVATTFPDIAKQWHPTKNGDLTSDMVTAGSNRKVWWLGKCGHEWETSLVSRTGKDKTGCPYCSGKKVLPGFNDLASKYPHLVEEWHPTKNGDLTPETTGYGVPRLIWWRCGKGHEWQASPSNRGNLKSGCPQCWATGFVSKAEKQVAEFVEKLGFRTETNIRNIIKGELDIYIPEKQVAVEFNGLYWHNENAGKGKNYHRDKWLACKQEGIQLVQIWEDDWNRNPELIKRMLAHKLGVSQEQKVYARRTTVEKVDSSAARKFLTMNHLQGYRVAKYYGLFDKEDHLVAVLGVSRKRDTGLEVIRYATSCNVVGGFSKLLNHVLKLEEWAHVEEVFSYSHNDYSVGGVYEANGFVLEHSGSPGYSYWASGWKEREHRLKYAPSRVKKNPGLVYVEGASERELAVLNNISRVWDSGSSLWVKRL